MHIAVIGGGLQGLCMALELAGRGARVALLESGPMLMQGASRHNEGKVHLGFVYANDPSLATARLMSLGACSFAPLLSQWLECDVAKLAVSTPYLYVVHRDSLLTADELAGRYEAIGECIREAAGRLEADYFGLRNAHRIRRFSESEISRRFDADTVQAVFETSEIAVDPDVVADLLVTRVCQEPRIRVRTATRVEAAQHLATGVCLTIQSGESSDEHYDHAINCAWDGRLALDASVGIKPDFAWSFRRKYFLRLPSSPRSAELPSATIVLGGFGDTVLYPGGESFLSWYPIACRGIELGLVPSSPDGALTVAESQALAEGIVRELGRIIPAVLGVSAGGIRGAQLRHGVIFALGTTDVDDRHSQLHRRHEVGPRSVGRYHTIDTGKYTMAPMFARQLADRICPVARGGRRLPSAPAAPPNEQKETARWSVEEGPHLWGSDRESAHEDRD